MSAVIRYRWTVEFYSPRRQAKMRLLCGTRAHARTFARMMKKTTGGSAIVRPLSPFVERAADADPLERA